MVGEGRKRPPTRIPVDSVTVFQLRAGPGDARAGRGISEALGAHLGAAGWAAAAPGAGERSRRSTPSSTGLWTAPFHSEPWGCGQQGSVGVMVLKDLVQPRPRHLPFL